MWTSFSDLVTPTSLFFFLNLIIAAIALTSHRKTKTNNLFQLQLPLESDHHYQFHNPLTPVASLIHRVRSFNFSLSSLTSDAQIIVSESSLPNTPTAIDRASSLLARMKSLNYFSSPQISRSETSELKTNQVHPDLDFFVAPTLSDCNNVNDDHQVKRIKSESQVSVGEGERPRKNRVSGEAKMTKSASEKRVTKDGDQGRDWLQRPMSATVRLHKAVSIGDDHEVDSKADDFIDRFKQQLKLQRLDSLLRNRELLRAHAHKQKHTS